MSVEMVLKELDLAEAALRLFCEEVCVSGAFRVSYTKVITENLTDEDILLDVKVSTSGWEDVLTFSVTSLAKAKVPLSATVVRKVIADLCKWQIKTKDKTNEQM